MINVAVIIPYYQKREGILRRALDSVVAQQLPPEISMKIIVVDDGSPASVDEEIKGLEIKDPHRLQIVRQPNGGVAAARNAGLDHTDDDVRYIAFLDSDDIWNARHLGRAVEVLEQGYDYYFCDCRRVGNEKSYFSEKDFAQFLYRTKAQNIADHVFEPDKEAFYRFSLRNRVSMIPTIVYRREVAPGLRFDQALRVAGEDCLFLFQLIEKSGRVCCVLEEMVSCADGVNIYSSNFDWNEPGHLARHMGLLLMLYRFRETLRLTEDDFSFFNTRIRKLRQAFAFLSMRYCMKYRTGWSAELSEMIRSDRRFWRWYPLHVAYVGVCYPLGLYNPLQEW